MQSWHNTYLGLKDLPRELSAFKLQAFFTFSRDEREVIDARYGATPKLGLALRVGFLRLSGRSLDSVRVVPASLWAHLGKELGVRSPDVASLKAMYGRTKTLFDHRQLAREGWGFVCRQSTRTVPFCASCATRLPGYLTKTNCWYLPGVGCMTTNG
jgi:hypothetical protein